MVTIKSARLLASIVLISGAIADSTAHQAQNARGHSNAHRGGHRGPTPISVGLPVLIKTCSFPVVALKLPHFSLIDSRTVMLPEGFLGKGSPKTQAVFLVYSHVGKNGGVTSLYEAPAQKGFTPDQLIGKIVDGRIFRDVSHGNPWSMRTTVVGKTVVGAGSSVSFALDDVFADLKH